MTAAQIRFQLDSINREIDLSIASIMQGRTEFDFRDLYPAVHYEEDEVFEVSTLAVFKIVDLYDFGETEERYFAEVRLFDSEGVHDYPDITPMNIPLSQFCTDDRLYILSQMQEVIAVYGNE